MRKITLVLASIVVFLLAACNSAESADSDDSRPYVVATFTVLADMVQAIGQEHIRVESVISPGTEVHSYEPTPRDIAKAHVADLIVYNGLGMEAWLTQFLAQSDAPQRMLTEGVSPISIAGSGSGSAGEELANPHAWMSPLDAQIYVDNIVSALSEIEPAQATAFETNGAAYKAELEQIRGELVVALDQIPVDKRVLVTCEGAFSYLARDAGLTEKYLWPVNSEQQATPQLVSGVIDYVNEHEVPAVFCESTVSDKAMQQVLAETDAQFGGVLYVDSLSGPDGPVGTYLELLTYTAGTIAAALQAEQ